MLTRKLSTSRFLLKAIKDIAISPLCLDNGNLSISREIGNAKVNYPGVKVSKRTLPVPSTNRVQDITLVSQTEALRKSNVLLNHLGRSMNV